MAADEVEEVKVLDIAFGVAVGMMVYESGKDDLIFYVIAIVCVCLATLQFLFGLFKK